MDILAELVLQLLFEVVGQFLAEVAFNGADWLWKSRVGRFLVWFFVNGVVAFVLGMAWGRHVAEVDPSTTPMSVWVSLAFAVAFLVVVLVWRKDLDELGAAGRWYSRFISAEKLWWMVLFNVVLAVGIWRGFESSLAAPLR